jgi:polygalacturonase
MGELHSRRHFLLGMAAIPALAEIVQFGAVPDGVTLSTAAIQKAIDDRYARGGGTVVVPPGRFLTGTLVLKSRVRLWLEPGAVLLGSTRLADFPENRPEFRSFTDTYTDKSLIYAENADQVSIAGYGTIDGQGKTFPGPHPYKIRPYLIRIVSCRDVSVTDIELRDSPTWVQHYLNCDRVNIRGVRVHSQVNNNNDGIDIDCCDRVRISDCEIVSGDDAIVLKSTANRTCRNVTVTNCTVTTNCSALKLGTESNGGFEDIAFSNCTLSDIRLAGIAVEMVDGGLLDRVTFSNITMNRVGAPIFIRLGDRGRPFTEGGPAPGKGRLRNVSIFGALASECGPRGCAISGIPGHNIENVAIENVRLEFQGGGKVGSAPIPEYPEKYPEYSMFGTLPAYGFYCRHVQNIRFRGVDVSARQPEERPAIMCDDVTGLELEGRRILRTGKASWNTLAGEPNR